MEKGKVVGVGGIFFKCEDPKSTKQWYENHLGMATDEYGALFEFRKSTKSGEVGYLQWSPMDQKTDYFDPSSHQFMVNYRVQGIELLVEQLKKDGVEVVDDIATYDYGKFVHILDPDGRKIELWEPVDNVFEEGHSRNAIRE